jgi:alpha-L-rhamnosidase
VPEVIPAGLRIGGRRDPLGIDNPTPALSWQLVAGDARGVGQSAYEVQVFDEGDGVQVWDSGRVESSRSIDVPYGGPALPSRGRYRWTVRTWIGTDPNPGAWSEPAWWEMGLLESEDWQALWIAAPDPEAIPDVEGVFRRFPAPIFRTELTLDEAPRRARAYATALGLYELWINGSRVGDQVLAPGWTDYHQRVQYQTYDVTDLLSKGVNAVAVLVGDGWYCGTIATLGPFRYGDTPALLVQLEAQTADGRYVVVGTDQTWRTIPSPIISNDLLAGEVEDGRTWPNGWNLPGCDDTGWEGAALSAPPGAELVASLDEGTSVIDSLSPVEVTWREGASIVDMGQNMVGHVRLDVDVSAGTTVTIRHGEMLEPDGSLYTANLLSARATDTFVTGGGPQRFEPRFTYHGFRFVEVTGLPEPIRHDQIEGRVVSANLERTGDFSCSDPMLDQLQRNIVWGQRGNFVSIPTDCPQRDERLGWTADAQVFAPTAAFNGNVLPFFRKWLIDLADAQLPSGGYPDVAPARVYGGVGNAAWGDAGILLPWTLHVRYGVTDVLERHYTGMRRHMEYLRAGSTDLIRSAGRYGDWVGLEGITPKAVIGTAYLAHCASVLTRIARVLGDEGERDRYETLHAAVREAFVQRFVGDDGSIEGRTQVGLVLALAMDLIPEDLRDSAAALLASDVEARGEHLATGFLGTPMALPVLSDHGYHELACRVAQQRTLPSWGFQVEHGATTVWERWDGWTPDRGIHPSSMNSFNHYAFGSIGDWLYRYVGGLDPDPDHPGYGRARIRPRPGGTLDHARLWHESPRGRWEVAWELAEGGVLSLDVRVPPGATASVVLPSSDPQALRYDGDVETLDGATVQGGADGTEVRIGSGRYRFQAPMDDVERR